MIGNFYDFLKKKPTLRFMLVGHRNKKRQFSCRRIQDERCEIKCVTVRRKSSTLCCKEAAFIALI